MMVSVRARMAAVAVALVLSAACREDGSGIRVASLRFNGVHAVREAQLRGVLATRAGSRFPWGVREYFTREQFEADLARIVAFYRDRGYPDAHVASFDVLLNSDQTAVDITLNIEEGQPVLVEALHIEGLPRIPPRREQAFRNNLPLKAGQPLDRALLQATRETAVDILKDHGYPYGTVAIVEAPGTDGRDRIVTLKVTPGQLARFGPIEITGNSSVSDEIVRRQLTFRPGDLFRQSRVVESQRRLFGLEVFQFASVRPETDEQAADVPTKVTLTEGKHRRVNFAFGYGSEEKARAEINWRHVNFFGGARTAGVVGRYSSLDRGVRLNFNQPFVFGRSASLSATGQVWHSDQPAYVLDSAGGRLTLAKRFGRVTNRGFARGAPSNFTSITYANEKEEYVVSEDVLADPSQWDDLIAIGIDPRTGEGHGVLSSFSFDAGRDTTGSVLDARRGYVLSGHVEQAGRWLDGTYDFVEVTAEGRYFQPMGSRAVLAFRARAGSINGYGDDPAAQVPFFKRYFLGGSGTLRGWGRYDVSPLTEFGEPIGGQTTFNFSTEVRVPVTGKLGAVFFLDGGNVWEDPWAFDLNDMRYDVGPGLRYDTPIGPLRVDVGFQLNPIPGLMNNGEPEKRHFRIHFSIGQAF